MKLKHSITGPQDGLPVLLVHGLFGQGRNLGALARRIAADRPVVTVDLRNHGDSPHSEEQDYPAMAQDLIELIEGLGGRADVAGHSMGGKAAMTLALTRPDLVRKLCVMDIAPIAYGHSQSHLIDAMQSLDLSSIGRRSQADAALREAIPEAGIRAFLLQSLDITPDRTRWRLNLPVLKERMPDLVGWPDNLPRAGFEGPVLALTGAESDYVLSAGQAALREYFPQVRIVTLKQAGHWLHADAPEAVANSLSAFFGTA
ncbi:alpha/beta fold hydrolase [Paracoccus sp. Z330]|uniref:Alpha/beta fold hydrolase n=1 Tax=Paracoccus onchidii TaxID=3017813 RepID=A0ABT4ZB49_9RHOB|nr:alpha/beta fold hydrolase [Paracoccus onchidii]MDB6176168.1 alpha/beta fold hydrolase [Paracoccus onchidii]